MKKLFLFIFTITWSVCLKSQTIYFPPLTGNTWDTISPSTMGYCQARIDSLYAFLDSNNTKSFILLKDGKIVLEKYFGTQTQNSFWQWASAGKSLTSFVVGLAQQDGYLHVTDTSSKYLGKGWTTCTAAQENKITILNQLTMTSGLDDGVPDNSCTQDTCLKYKADAGTRWAYHNAPYTLLDSVIHTATGVTLNQYLTQKVKTPTGMTGTFVKVGNDNVFFSNARSMARYGLLILNKGTWNNTKIMTDTTYFSRMTNTSQTLNKSYGYLWWLNGKSSYMVPQSQFVFPGALCPNAPSDMISAMGKDGQFLNVIPSQGLVWVRMGNAPDNLPVPFLLNDAIWKYVNALRCSANGLPGTANAEASLSLYPNPGTERLKVKANGIINSLEIYNLQGQMIFSMNPLNPEVDLSVMEWAHGLYLVKATLSNGQAWTGRWVKP